MASLTNGIPLPKLTKDVNYDNWKVQMKALLGSQDNWDVVENGHEEPVTTEGYTNAQLNALKVVRAKDKAALYLLYRAVDESGFEKIANAKSSKEAWDILEKATWGGRSNTNNNIECYNCGKYGHVAKECYSIKCYNCGNLGHISKDCRSEKKREEPTNFHAEEEDEGLLLVTTIPEAEIKPSCSSEVKPNCSDNSVWYLDTGASNHMCGDEHLFKMLSKEELRSVSFGDASKVAVKGRGTIWYQQRNEKIGEIRDVYYVPDLKSNILSMGQLMEKGYSVLMKDRELQLKDKLGRLIAQVEMKKNRMYKLELKIVQDECMQLDLVDEAMKWHLRFGHLHFRGLTELVKKEMVFGLPKIEFEKKFCEECVIGKHARTSFPRSSEYRAKEQLGLIHTDLCGPITPESFSGKKYFVSFIDDFSRKTWVYFLKEKLEVFETFKKFKVMVEKETSKFIKAVRSDRGGEFTSVEFNKYCEEHGIKRFLTAPYSPQQNGVAERKNRTILDMVRSMLKGKNMPKKFWAEAVQCAVYVQNRCPHAKLGEKTPQEIWSGMKPSVSHLRVFGSLAYGQVPRQHRTKLEDRSKKYIFIGYDEKSKAYKLYDPDNKKVVVSRDVHVEETKQWCWSNSIEVETSSDIVVPSTTTMTEFFDEGSELHTLEGLEENFEICSRKCITWSFLLKIG
uniref:Retrovirus-related Pol polyprotein from transposon TNT 1-94 n=1 Tax=Cajanus cajan TaxID=3821 RepID=A0A151QZZ3_CAJCA|nr:Retrovirus-related Pol polyprotein from transposon TNT 1-94 [Cajanus cajan]